MTIRNVGDLRRALEEFPDYYEVGAEVIVGGDLGTDTVDLAEVRAETLASSGTTVILVPAPDEYAVREHIDNGLAAYYAIADAGDLGNGFLRYTRTEAGELILDHVDAARVVIIEQ